MYRTEEGQLHIFDITMEDTFKLDPNNRWVKRSQSIPWAMAEGKYSHMFKKNGRPAKQIRMALGALLIKEFLQCSDVETVENIKENPYLQHFIGLKNFTNEAPFDPSLMVWFRKRLSKSFMDQINETMCLPEAKPKPEPLPEQDDDDGPPHGGTMIVDASCTPGDITYPTDTGLLAEAIEKTDGLIDTMQEPLKGIKPRPRTYRKKSRKLFVTFIKNRKPPAKLIYRVVGKQLNYLKRNLSYIEKMQHNGGLLTGKQKATLETIKTLYNQQGTMHKEKHHQTEDRIVSISQPHIRPIVRGKAGRAVEFGAKVNIYTVNGYTFLDNASYDAFHEGNLLEYTIARYYMNFGMLPKKILADRIYVTRENRKMCKKLKIALMGKPLGRPPKGAKPETNKKDIGCRNEVEGDIGTLKTRYGWGRIMARLPETGMAVISLSILAMNLGKKAREFFRHFVEWVFWGINGLGFEG